MAIDNQYLIQSYTGKQLQLLLAEQWQPLANCYCDVFNESWGESWTLHSAQLEINRALASGQQRKPLLAQMFIADQLVGFTIGAVVQRDLVSAEDMPFDLEAHEKQQGRAVLDYYLRRVVKSEQLLLWSHTGILKEHRKNNLYSMALPIFQFAADQGCPVVMMWTDVSMPAFKLAVSIGLTPIHYFITNNLCLMAGSVNHCLDYLKSSPKLVGHGGYNRASQRLRHYFCY